MHTSLWSEVLSTCTRHIRYTSYMCTVLSTDQDGSQRIQHTHTMYFRGLSFLQTRIDFNIYHSHTYIYTPSMSICISCSSGMQLKLHERLKLLPICILPRNLNWFQHILYMHLNTTHIIYTLEYNTNSTYTEIQHVLMAHLNTTQTLYTLTSHMHTSCESGWLATFATPIIMHISYTFTSCRSGWLSTHTKNVLKYSFCVRTSYGSGWLSRPQR